LKTERSHAPLHPEPLLIKSLIERASVYCLIGQNESASLDVRSGIRRSKKFKKPELLADCLLQSSEIAGTVNDFRRTLTAARNALAIYRRINDQKGIGACLNNIGFAYDSFGEYKKAVKYYQRSLLIDRRLGDREGQAISYCNIGSAHGSLGDFRKALKFFARALSMEKRTGNLSGRVKSINNIAGVYYRLGDHHRALRYYLSCMKTMDRIGDRKGLAVVLSNISAVQKSLGNFQRSLETYLKSLRIKEEIADRGSQATNYRHIGGLYHSLGDPNKALSYYRKALTLWRRSGDRQGQAICLNELAVVHTELEEHKKALCCLAGARDLAEKLRAKNIAFMVCMTSAEAALARPSRARVNTALARSGQALELARAMKTKPSQTEALLLRARVNAAFIRLPSTRLSTIKRQAAWRHTERGFKTAIRAYEKLNRPWEAARARYFYGEFAARTGLMSEKADAEKIRIIGRAVRHLRKARAFFKHIGNRRYLKRITAILNGLNPTGINLHH
jgi:tetratricopeptide (TPR) repeat protein